MFSVKYCAMNSTQQSLILTEPTHHHGGTPGCSIAFTDRDALSVELPMLIGTETEITTSEHGKHSGHISKLVSPTNSTHFENSIYLESYPGAITPSRDEKSNEMLIDDKKHKDMMRKRQLRQSTAYRQQETIRSRNRMKLRRSNPEYRERERIRDRERRRLARSTNPEKRAVERERDRLYKKRMRSDSKVEFIMSATTVSHEVILHDSSSPHHSIDIDANIDAVLDNSHSNNIITLNCMSDKSGGLIMMKDS